MNLNLCSLVVLLGWTFAAQPALAQPAQAAHATTRTAILDALSAGDIRRAYGAYDRFVETGGRHDASLLAPIAAEELRAIGQHATDDPSLQAEALERLARRGDTQALSDLQRMATSRPNTGVAALADGALARLGDANALTRLAAMASSSAMSNKAIVAEAIRRSGSRQYAGAVVPLLTDPDWQTRIQTVRALAELGYTAAIPEIRTLLTDENPQVRSSAAVALKRLGDPGGDEQSAAMLRSGNAGARLEGLQADPGSSRADINVAARQLAADPDPLNRVKAAEALAGDDPAAALTVLRRAAEDSDSTTRRLAARGLEGLRPTDVALLRRLLEDESGWVRMYAAGGVLAAAEAK
jgi:HEAT repeat protein